jgi:ABC-2 type transport system permease protein
MLGSLDNADNVIGTIKIAYSIETQNSAQKQGIEAFLTAAQDNSFLELHEINEADVAKNMVDNKEYSAFIVFKEPFAIELYEGFNNIHNRTINSILSGFSRNYASYAIIAHIAPETLLNNSPEINTDKHVVPKDFEHNRSMLDYYAVAMCVMIIFMGNSIGGASAFYEGRKDGTVNRLLATPKNRIIMYIQHIFGAIPQSVIPIVVIMLTSTFAFGAKYANNLGDNLLLFAMFVICGISVTSICFIFGMFLKINPMIVFMPINWVLLFFSGTFSKEIFISGISNYSPVWLIQNASFDLTIFGRGEKCIEIILICAIVLVISTFIGALLFKRKGIMLK